MAFWGIVVKPGKPYMYMHFGDRGKLRISQAILGADSRSSTERSILECHVEDKEPVYICSLEPKKLETCPLNLEFDECNLVMFKVIGPCSIHLSGFYFGESKNTFSLLPEEQNTGSSESNGTDSEERENVVKRAVVPVFESEDEDEDGFPICFPRKGNAGVNAEGKETEMEDDKTNKEPEQKKANSDPSSLKSLKRKVNATGQNGEEARKTVQLVDSSLATTEDIAEHNTKKTKKNKKKKLGGQEETTFEASTDSKSSTQTKETTTLDIDQALPIGKEHDGKLTTQKSIDVDADSTAEENHSENKKKKKTGKIKKQESGVNANKGQTSTGEHKSTMEIEGSIESKPFQVRTFPNGLVIEELAMGKPDGKRASPGKKVSVHYIGKLKKDGKIFDSNIGRAPFKFRLGIGQVVKGWDVGVNGMRIGDKRRLTIPPAMGYGSSGAGPIPPNAWLLFDVELVDVR